MVKKRYKLVEDDDGHWYLLPERKWKVWDEFWQQYTSDDWEEFVDHRFEECRVDGPHSVIITSYEELE